MNVELGAADGGSRRSLSEGAKVRVRLDETPTTGYQWQVEDDPALRLVGDHFEGPTEPRGAGGSRVLDFEVVRSGPARLHLTKRRAWGDDTPVDEFLVELDVQPGDDGS